MAPPSRRPDPPLTETLFGEGFRFEFFQAVRVLERLRPERAPVGREAKPGDEVVRFHTETSLVFPASTVSEIEDQVDGEPASMLVPFMGMTGILGPLPRHYSELLLERVRRKDLALRDFLDMFNHRLISLFYRAWEKYRFSIGYERAARVGGEYDPITETLFADFGMGTAGLRSRLAVDEEPLRRYTGLPATPGRRSQIDDDTLLFYAGLLADHRRPGLSLEGLLEDYFGVKTRVDQLTGRWLELDHAGRSSLGRRRGAPSNNVLGDGAVLGSRVWDQQAAFGVRLGPVSFARLCQLVPSGEDFVALLQLVHFFAGPECDFDVTIGLNGWEVPGCQLGAAGAMGPRLGWSTWLKSPDRLLGRDPTDTVLGWHLTRVGGVPG